MESSVKNSVMVTKEKINVEIYLENAMKVCEDSLRISANLIKDFDKISIEDLQDRMEKFAIIFGGKRADLLSVIARVLKISHEAKKLADKSGATIFEVPESDCNDIKIEDLEDLRLILEPCDIEISLDERGGKGQAIKLTHKERPKIHDPTANQEGLNLLADIALTEQIPKLLSDVRRRQDQLSKSLK